MTGNICTALPRTALPRTKKAAVTGNVRTEMSGKVYENDLKIIRFAFGRHQLVLEMGESLEGRILPLFQNQCHSLEFGYKLMQATYA